MNDNNNTDNTHYPETIRGINITWRLQDSKKGLYEADGVMYSYVAIQDILDQQEANESLQLTGNIEIQSFNYDDDVCESCSG